MPRHPDVFVSAASKDLASYRVTVAGRLRDLGAHPVEQGHFAPDPRTVREMLRDQITGCDAVVHLVGFCYGAEPLSTPKVSPRRSYTQLEYEIAIELSKPVYVFLATPTCPLDPHQPEPDDVRQLQLDHRTRLQNGDALWYTFNSHAELLEHINRIRFTTAPLESTTTPTRLSMSSRPLQLPLAVPDFTGREAEIARMTDRLSQGGGAWVIRGMGGVGKTTLAVKVAHAVKNSFPDAQLVVELRGMSERPMTVAEAMARVIRDLQSDPGKLPDDEKELAGRYRSALAGRRVLIVLDDARDEAQVKELLTAGPPTGFLITSRKTLRLRNVNSIPLDVLSLDDAVGLLQGIVDGSVEKDQLALLVDLCGRLPLALRVAGDFLRTAPNWTVAKYISAVRSERNRFRRLKGATQDEDVEAVLGFSASMLVEQHPEAAARWQMLSVFPRSFDVSAAARVWDMWQDGCPDADRTEDEFTLLLDRSLITFEPKAGRYALHDLMRLVARDAFKYRPEHPLAMGSAERIQIAELRLARHYCGVLATAERLYLQGGEGVSRGLALFDTEADSIRYGWQRAVNSLDERDYAELARDYPLDAPLVTSLRIPEGERKNLLEQAVEASSRLGDRKGEGRAITGLGETHFDLGQFRTSIACYERGLAIAIEVRDRLGEGLALSGLGEAQAELGETRAAIIIYERALVVFRELGDLRREGQALGSLGRAQAELGDISTAVGLYQRWMAIARQIGDQWSEGQATGCLGLAHASLGNLREAVTSYERWLAITRQIGYKRGEAAALGNLGHAHADLGDLDTATSCYEQWLAVTQEIGDRRGQGDAIGNLGRIYTEQGDLPKSLSCQELRLVIARETEDAESEGFALFGIAHNLMALGRRDEAVQRAEQSLGRLESVRSPRVEDVRRAIVKWSNPTID
jgi:tetratricopeptide (TPR) repeat protein